jgi:hypothetical protein
MKKTMPHAFNFGPLAFLLVSIVFLSCTPPAQAERSADETVTWVVESLQNNQPQVLWQALPSSYQSDIQAHLRTLADSTDEQIWNQTFQTLHKMIRVLDEKRDFIFQQPLLAARLQQAPDASASYDGVVRVLKAITTSEISDLQQVRELDVESFLAGTMSEIMTQVEVVSELAPESVGTVQGWKSVQATLVRSEGDNALLKIESDEEAAMEVEFVRVEEKWIPKKLADSWESSMAELGEGIQKMSALESPQQKQQTLMFLAMANGVTDTLLATETLEEFNGALAGVLGLAMSQMGSASEGN